MVAAVIVASLFARRAAATLVSSHDPRFRAPDYSLGPSLPFPVIMDNEHGWTYLAILFALLAALAVLSAIAARALASCGDRAPSMLVGGVAVAAAAMCFLPLTFSLDEYAYAAFGRMMAVAGLDPYAVRSLAAVQGDPVLARLGAFLGAPLPADNYGPLWTMFASAAGAATRSGGLTAIVAAHRIASALALVVATLGVARLLAGVAPQVRASRASLFALHPAVLYESAGAGHNDMLMIAPAIWAFALVDASPLWAGLLAGAAMAIKYAAAIALPFLTLRAYRSHGGAKAAGLALLAVAVPVVLFAPFRHDLADIGSLLQLRANPIVSLSWLIGMWAPAAVPQLAIEASIGAIAAVVALWSIAGFARTQSCGDVFRTVAAALWASPLLNPWYVLWLTPAAAAATGRIARYAWWFALLAPLRYVEDALRYPATAADLSARIALLAGVTVAVLVLPVALALASPRVPRRAAAGNA